MNFRLKFSVLIEFYKKNGIKNTINKILKKLSAPSGQKRLQKEENKNYKLWIKNNEPNKEELEKQREYKFEYEPKISIIVPMYNTKEKYLEELLESIIGQTYSNWELCIADGSPEQLEYVKRLVNQDKRIKYKFLNGNRGIAENSNEALKLATGDYIALLDHDDILPIFCLYEVVKVINEDKEAEFIYTDEDKLWEKKENRVSPHFKQDFAPDTLMSYNYICHFSIFKKGLMDKLKGFNKEFDGSQDYDLILRATEQANRIVHIPKILYHWRMNVDSVALASNTKTYAYDAAKKAILQHLERMGTKAKVEDSKTLGMYKVEYEVENEPKISIIIPNMDHKRDLKRCIRSILQKSTYKNYEIIIVENNSKTKEIFKYYDKLKENSKIKILEYKEKEFNYSKINNFGVKNSKGQYIVLLNNDTKIITQNWMELMLGNCQRKDVGIVGAKLLYPNGKIQHMGIVLGVTGVAGHVNLGLDSKVSGYMGRNTITQNYNAVTGAMLMISREDYFAVNGLDENMPVSYNDVDLCLKIRQLGKVVVVNSLVKAYHYESKTRGYEISKEKIKRLEEDSKKLKNKWKDVFEKEDQYFSPNLRHDTCIIKINPEKV
ncbi:MAG: glycosyltransferase [Clostridia bacterium]|nr:glycosyltransferase [Clostridia bacterium]